MKTHNQKIDRLRPLEDPSVLKEWLDYDPTTGVFKWNKSPAKAIPAGRIAGWKTPKGYIAIGHQGINYFAHRLAWLYMTGELPAQTVDHINGISVDNQWLNLRICDQADNAKNRKMHANNACGFKGVWKDPTRTINQYVAQIRANGKRIQIGRFKTPELAHEAYLEAASRLHGEFSRTDPS